MTCLRWLQSKSLPCIDYWDTSPSNKNALIHIIFGQSLIMMSACLTWALKDQFWRGAKKKKMGGGRRGFCICCKSNICNIGCDKFFPSIPALLALETGKTSRSQRASVGWERCRISYKFKIYLVLLKCSSLMFRNKYMHSFDFYAVAWGGLGSHTLSFLFFLPPLKHFTQRPLVYGTQWKL